MIVDRRVCFSVLLCLLACGVAAAGESPNGGPQGGMMYVFCSASLPQSQLPNGAVKPAVTYFSAAFATDAQNLRVVNDAFLKYLVPNQGFKPQPGDTQPVACTAASSLDDARSIERARATKASHIGGRVVETGWTYSPDGAAH